MFNEYNDIVSFSELCEMLRIGRSKAYRLLQSGAVEGFQSGRTWMIPKQAVIDFVEKSRQQRRMQ